MINKKIDIIEKLQQIDLNVFEDDNCASYTSNNGGDYKRIHTQHMVNNDSNCTNDPGVKA